MQESKQYVVTPNYFHKDSLILDAKTLTTFLNFTSFKCTITQKDKADD